MRIFEILTEANGSGCYIAAKPTLVSLSNIIKWMDEQQIPNQCSPDSIHTTIMYTKDRKIPWNNRNYRPAVKLDSNTFKLDLFGEDNNMLVLKFDSEFLTREHNRIKKKYGLSWDYDSYIPHITLAKNIDESLNIKTIELPPFHIYLSHDFMEENKKAKTAKPLINKYNQPTDISETAGVGTIQPQNQTVDVGPDEIQKQAKKWGWELNKNNEPPLIDKVSKEMK